jgi:hypothetical protein
MGFGSFFNKGMLRKLRDKGAISPMNPQGIRGGGLRGFLDRARKRNGVGGKFSQVFRKQIEAGRGLEQTPEMVATQQAAQQATASAKEDAEFAKKHMTKRPTTVMGSSKASGL